MPCRGLFLQMIFIRGGSDYRLPSPHYRDNCEYYALCAEYFVWINEPSKLGPDPVPPANYHLYCIV